MSDESQRQCERIDGRKVSKNSVFSIFPFGRPSKSGEMAEFLSIDVFYLYLLIRLLKVVTFDKELNDLEMGFSPPFTFIFSSARPASGLSVPGTTSLACCAGVGNEGGKIISVFFLSSFFGVVFLWRW